MFSTNLSRILVKEADCMASSIPDLKMFPPENSFKPINSPQGIILPEEVTVRKHLPPPQGEISHIRRRAFGATIPNKQLVKFPIIILCPDFFESAIALSTASIKYFAISASSGFK